MRCPNGYRIKIVAHNKTWISAYESNDLPNDQTKTIWFMLHKGGSPDEVGYVDMVLTKHGFWETHASLDEEEQGKGFGLMLYAKAIDFALRKGLEIRSSASPSNDAKRTWMSTRLNALFEIDYHDSRFHVRGRKTQRHR